MSAPWLLLAALALAAGAALAKDRPPRLLGGLMDAEENDEGVQRALRFAMSEYNKASNDMYRSRVAELLQARKQVREGDDSSLCKCKMEKSRDAKPKLSQ
ncbi:enoyl-CoA hydratase [Platysternon megacephalum]|uniref:Enoyl-CoA hydratase n=1 Tax=Platysternon megacephalum TaxID=55544 RepID=A0A4D9DFT5_9SAUR|nr:enoyl-CoA hydratase [Platysternon megacephalum]